MTAIELLLGAAGAPESGLFDTLAEWFHLEQGWRKWLIAFGFVGQAVFFGRWIVQWIASERRGESHVPELFWWCSLIGAMMLFTYFALDRDPVGMLGQAVGWTVYTRNLYLIKAKHRRPAQATPPAGQ